jgi:hypothetical protein
VWGDGDVLGYDGRVKPLPPPDDDYQWIRRHDGVTPYEYLERLAICWESKVPMREAAKIADEQMRWGAWSMPARPY